MHYLFGTKEAQLKRAEAWHKRNSMILGTLLFSFVFALVATLGYGIIEGGFENNAASFTPLVLVVISLFGTFFLGCIDIKSLFAIPIAIHKFIFEKDSDTAVYQYNGMDQFDGPYAALVSLFYIVIGLLFAPWFLFTAFGLVAGFCILGFSIMWIFRQSVRQNRALTQHIDDKEMHS